jgi:SAM-dependent methyltransferase
VTEWFEQWFGEEYLHAYSHRDDEDAARLVRFLERQGVGGPGRRMLDLACGPGRHAAAFGAGGARVVGLDLSRALLFAARRRGVSPLARGDMRRLPFRDAAFDVVVNLFTSFGYFASDAEHEGVLGEVARVLRTGGRFVLDFLNASAVRAGLVPRDERRGGGATVIQERRISDDGRYVVKSVHVEGEGRTFTERVRLLGRDDLEGMLAAQGIRVEGAAGDYDGAPHSAASPRLILLGRRA